MWNPFRRAERPAARVAVTVESLRIPEVTVRHVIERKIPRPTMITFTAYDNQGRQFRLMPIDLSYRDSVPVQLPMAFLTGDPSAAPCELRAELHYDPRDQR